jgi:hypothetical protein
MEAYRQPDRLTLAVGGRTYLNIRERDDVMVPRLRALRCHHGIRGRHRAVVARSREDDRAVDVGELDNSEDGFRAFAFATCCRSPSRCNTCRSRAKRHLFPTLGAMHFSLQRTLLGASTPSSTGRCRARPHRARSRGVGRSCPGWLTGADGLFDGLLADSVGGSLGPHVRQGARRASTARHPRRGRCSRGRRANASRAQRAVRGRVHVGTGQPSTATDATAWPGTEIEWRATCRTHVAIVSLGGRRRFLLRPRAVGDPRGSIQPRRPARDGRFVSARWQHTVPKVRRAALPLASSAHGSDERAARGQVGADGLPAVARARE